jgi:hypothetical protein
MAFILYLIGIAITYFIIKFAVRQAISESLGNVKSVVKEALIEGLSEYEYKKQNK